MQVVGDLQLVVGRQTEGQPQVGMSGSFAPGIADIFISRQVFDRIIPHWRSCGLAAVPRVPEGWGGPIQGTTIPFREHKTSEMQGGDESNTLLGQATEQFLGRASV